VRRATTADLAALAEIEQAADALFREAFDDPEWDEAPSGEQRVADGGFILVAAAAAAADGPPVGFAHVVEPGGPAHLEQLSVRPDAGRRGHGRALVAAVLAEAGARGHSAVTLRTYAEVPWNAPFYGSCGFTVADRDDEFAALIMDVEQRLQLERHGPRVWMAAPTG
jgi:GNAT superfamily N-acetyltransferase